MLIGLLGACAKPETTTEAQSSTKSSMKDVFKSSTGSANVKGTVSKVDVDAAMGESMCMTDIANLRFEEIKVTYAEKDKSDKEQVPVKNASTQLPTNPSKKIILYSGGDQPYCPDDLVYLRSEGGETFLILKPDYKPKKKQKFAASEVMWRKSNGDVVRRKSFYWVTPRNRDPDNIFWLKYSSKFDIKLVLDRPVTTWQDLLSATIEDVKEDDYGKRDILKIDNTWYFTALNPIEENAITGTKMGGE